MRLRVLVVVVSVALCSADAFGRTTLKPGDDYDTFAFHGQFYEPPGAPIIAAAPHTYAIEVWNSQGELVYAQVLPEGACVDAGNGCRFRDKVAQRARSGIAQFRMKYATESHGNKVWTKGYGEFTAPMDSQMSLVLLVDGVPYASLTDTWTPVGNGGWRSSY
jgi:hypothetical protein